MSQLSTFDALANSQHEDTGSLFIGQWQSWAVTHELWFAKRLRYAVDLPEGNGCAGVITGAIGQPLAAHYHEETSGAEHALWLADDRVVWAQTQPDYYDDSAIRLILHVSAKTAEQRDEIIRQLQGVLPEAEAPEEEIDENVIDLQFWTTSALGPQSNTRSIHVPGWEQIAHNYAVQEQLDPLMTPDFRPAGEGKLILWYGPAGTGKTHAVRALMHAWQQWCAPHYIMDPEHLFGDAQYLTALVSGFDTDLWNLLVIEDAGELLREDAADRSGQGLSRLLNLTDGLIGQGLRVLVLITTNEPFNELHQAVQRPGRCLSRLQFGQLDAEQATAWLQHHWPQAPPVDAPTSLAELFAQLPADAQPGRLEDI